MKAKWDAKKQIDVGGGYWWNISQKKNHKIRKWNKNRYISDC